MKPSTFRHVFVYLLIAIAVIVMISTVVRRPPPEDGAPLPEDQTADVNPWETGQGWAFCAPALFVMGAIMVITYQQYYKLAANIEKARFKEIPAQQSEIPEALMPTIQALTERGFTRIDDCALIRADDKPGGSAPAFIWPGNQVFAVVMPGSKTLKPNLSLETLYANGAVLNTIHPYGMSAKSPKREAKSIRRGTPGEAIDYHLRRMHEYTARQGDIYAAPPKDRAAWLSAFNLHHWSPGQIWLQQVGIWTIPILIFMIILTLTLNTNLFGDLQAYFIYGSCLLLIGWLVYCAISGRIILRR